MSGIPSSIILPIMGIEFDASRAQQGPAEMPFATLLIGQMLAAGSGSANTLTKVYSEAQVEELGGTGSMIHNMAKRYFKNNKFTDCYIIMLADDGTGTQATRTVTFSGTATEDGEYSLYVNGYRVAVPIVIGDTATTSGDALVTALADHPYLPFTAANNTGTVTFTARHKGIAAGDNDIRDNYEPTEKTPAGLSVTIGSTTPGTVDPDVQDAIDAMGDQWFNVIANGYDDSTNLGLLEDYAAEMFGPTIQRDGLIYQAKRDTVGNLTTFATGVGRNSPHCVLIDGGSRLCAMYELAAGVAGAMANSAQEDPAVPLHRVELIGFKPNIITERRLLTERNSLAKSGVMTLTDTNVLQTEATVTMYLKNSAGAADTAYRYQNRLFILMRLRYRFNNRILSKYPRAKLVRDAKRVKAGQQIISPEIGKAEAVAWFLEEEFDGQVEGIDQFKEDVICRISETNPDRLEWILPPDLVNQFIVGSGVMQFLV